MFNLGDEVAYVGKHLFQTREIGYIDMLDDGDRTVLVQFKTGQVYWCGLDNLVLVSPVPTCTEDEEDCI